MPRPTTATIHTDALRHNLGELRRRAPESRVMAVVKADAYGHGLERCADALSGADAFAVSTFEEAERLRAAGRDQRIVLLSGFDEAGTRYGLGWRISGDRIWHSGESLGFRNVLVRIPSQGVTLVMLSNRDDPEPVAEAMAIARRLVG